MEKSLFLKILRMATMKKFRNMIKKCGLFDPNYVWITFIRALFDLYLISYLAITIACQDVYTNTRHIRLQRWLPYIVKEPYI